MVPQDQLVSVGRIAQGAPLDKTCECLRLCHGVVAHIRREAFQTAVFHLIDLVAVGGDNGIVPAGTATGIDNDPDVF